MTRYEFTPIKAAAGWLVGTFALFLIVGEVTKVPDLFKLTAFVIATIGCLCAGYWLRIVRYRSAGDPPPSDPSVRTIRLLVAIGGVYYFAYGLSYMGTYGVRSIGAVTSALRDPGGAYLAKYDVFAAQLATNDTNPVAQALTLSAVLSAPLVPFLVVYWRHLTADVRILAFIGLGTYAACFLAIGTLVGLGNIVIFAGTGFLVARARGQQLGRRRRGGLAIVALLAILFAGYMSYNQSSRIQEVGIAGRYEPNPIAQAIVGDELARGVTVTAFYPTHGYLGLSYNLEQPFEWTEGRGSSRALDSYLDQYGFGTTVSADTYPERTEARTGWDAGVYWSTIYPWLASDLTWFGAALFMGLVGWWMARWWYEAVALGRPLAMLLFAQTCLLVAFVPANNQIGISRPNLICFVSLLALYVLFERRSEEPPSRLEEQRDVGGQGDVGGRVVVDVVGDGVRAADSR